MFSKYRSKFHRIMDVGYLSHGADVRVTKGWQLPPLLFEISI